MKTWIDVGFYPALLTHDEEMRQIILSIKKIDTGEEFFVSRPVLEVYDSYLPLYEIIQEMKEELIKKVGIVIND